MRPSAAKPHTDAARFPLRTSDHPVRGVANSQLLQLARHQFGIVHRTQLAADLGLTRSQITGLRQRSELVEMLPSTYRIASHPDTFLCRALATQLWAGGVGFLSSWSAARVYELRKMPADTIHFTVPAGFSRRTPRWIHLDRTSWYSTSDRRSLSTGLIVAEPERMLFGLAADINQRRFDRAVEDAWHRKLITPKSLAAYLEQHRCRGKNGVARLDRWLTGNTHRARPSQSHLEMLFIEAFDRVGLPPAVRQHPVTLPNGEVIHLDIAWPDIRLAVEPGAAWFHGGDAGQARDHDRDLACNELGWLIIRLDETNRSDPLSAARRVERAHRQRSLGRKAAAS